MAKRDKRDALERAEKQTAEDRPYGVSYGDIISTHQRRRPSTDPWWKQLTRKASGRFGDFIGPPWKHSNPETRLQAIRRLSDPSILLQVALTEQAKECIDMALQKITDEKVLATIAGEANFLYNRVSAIRKISDQALLAEIARTGRGKGTVDAAVGGITDQSLLVTLATNGGDLALAVVRKITDQSLLAEIARKEIGRSPDRPTSLLRAALAMITNKALLDQLAPEIAPLPLYGHGKGMRSTQLAVYHHLERLDCWSQFLEKLRALPQADMDRVNDFLRTTYPYGERFSTEKNGVPVWKRTATRSVDHMDVVRFLDELCEYPAHRVEVFLKAEHKTEPFPHLASSYSRQLGNHVDKMEIMACRVGADRYNAWFFVRDVSYVE